MARDACDAIAVSDWSLFMETNSAERVMFYFHSQPAPCSVQGLDGGDSGGAPPRPRLARQAGPRGLYGAARAASMARPALGPRPRQKDCTAPLQPGGAVLGT